MIEPTKYVMCGSNCKYPAYTAEEVLALLQQAIDNKSLEGIVSDTGFITKLKEKNSNKAIQLWIGTQAQYNALETKPQDTLCIFTDDSTYADLETVVENALKAAEEAKTAAQAASGAVSALEQSIKNGTTVAAEAAHAQKLATEVGQNTFEHGVKAQYPSNILSIANSESNGVITFLPKNNSDSGANVKLPSAGIYLVQGYEYITSLNMYNFVSTMIIAWDGEHVAVSNLGFLASAGSALGVTSKTIYLTAGTDGTLGCHLWDDSDNNMPTKSTDLMRSSTYEITLKAYKLGETSLLI